MQTTSNELIYNPRDELILNECVLILNLADGWVPIIDHLVTLANVIMTSWEGNQLRISRFAPSQWETVLLCNAVSHCLRANLESSLWYGNTIRHQCFPSQKDQLCAASMILLLFVWSNWWTNSRMWHHSNIQTWTKLLGHFCWSPNECVIWFTILS